MAVTIFSSLRSFHVSTRFDTLSAKGTFVVMLLRNFLRFPSFKDLLFWLTFGLTHKD